MKYVNRIFSVMLVLLLVFAASGTAFADDTYTITIENKMPNHIYEAYQIFSGDLSVNDEGKDVLINIVWGSGVSAAGQAALGDASEKAKTLITTEDGEAFADEVGPYLTSPSATSGAQTNDTYTLSGLTAGYYLVKDKDNSLEGKDDVYTCYILRLVNNVTAAPKCETIGIDKTQAPNSDNDNNAHADYMIGDDVPYTLTATLAENVSKFTEYEISFIDTLSSGLTYNGDAVVRLGNTNVTSYFTITYTNNVLTLSCSNVKAFGAGDGDIITVDYTAELNENAAIGAEGNPNSVELEYSNNPNGDGKGKTPGPTTKVYTFKLCITKVDEDGEALNGASFTLYKKNADGEYIIVGETQVGTDTNEFEWVGLDCGEYKLEETDAPTGYNKLEDLEFTIDSEFGASGLTNLTVDGDELAAQPSSGTVSGEVENKAGALLPHTGGIGTTIFYISGSILVVLALVLFVSKKRMDADV